MGTGSSGCRRTNAGKCDTPRVWESLGLTGSRPVFRWVCKYRPQKWQALAAQGAEKPKARPRPSRAGDRAVLSDSDPAHIQGERHDRAGQGGEPLSALWLPGTLQGGNQRPSGPSVGGALPSGFGLKTILARPKQTPRHWQRAQWQASGRRANPGGPARLRRRQVSGPPSPAAAARAGGQQRCRGPQTPASPRPAGLTWRCRPRKTTAKAPCPTRSLLLYSKSPTTSMAAPPGHTAGARAGGQRSEAGRAQHRGPAGPESAREPPDWGSRGPRPGRTLMPRGRSGNRGGLRAGPGSARPGPAPAAPHGPARRRPKAPLAKRPQRCPARGAAAVTVRPRSRTRAQERCGARCSPSPARPAASAPSARGAAAVAAAALGPAQPPSLRASQPRSGVQRTRARAGRSRADCRPSATSARLVGRSARRSPLPPPGKWVRARPGARRCRRGQSPSHWPKRGIGMRAAGTTAPYPLQPSPWAWEQIRACHAPGCEAGVGEAGLKLPTAGGTRHPLCRMDPREPVRARSIS